MFLSRWQDRQTLFGLWRFPSGPLKAMKQSATDFVFLQHDRHGLFLIDGGLAGSTALRVGRERLLKLVREAEIVHDQSAWFLAKHAIDPRDRLHESVPAHGFVHVHGMQ